MLPGGHVKCPPDGKNSFLSLLQDKTICDRYTVVCGISEVVDLTNEIVEQSSRKRNAEARQVATETPAKSQTMDLLQEKSWSRLIGIVQKPRNSFSATRPTSET
jgi:hypothetical protein